VGASAAEESRRANDGLQMPPAAATKRRSEENYPKL